MSSPIFSVFEGDGVSILPYRPALVDVGGGSKLDDAEFPPDPVSMFTAADFNQMSGLLVALCKVTPAALFMVANTGTPTISGVRAASSLLSAASFTVVDVGTGITEIKAAASKIIQPFAGVAFPQKTGDYRATAYINTTSDGLRVETRNGSGTLTDVDFLLMWI